MMENINRNQINMEINNFSKNPTLTLLEAIRVELENFYGRKINDKELSTFLGFNERYIATKFYRIRKGQLENFKFREFFKLKSRALKLFETSISKDLLKHFMFYEEYIKGYIDYKMSRKRSKHFHPFFKSDYFNVIDTKEKAYWLGFLYADGAIIEEINQKRNNKKRNRIKLSQNRKDRILIYRFVRTVGLNLKQIYYDERWDSYGINFRNHEMVNDLMKHGVLHRKSKIIQLPFLSSRELYLAFLLGYFDGDGETGTSRIISGSNKFLKQIKLKFCINYKIQKDIRETENGENSFCYALSLGAELFNEILTNYKKSLNRKRIKMITDLKEFHKIKFKDFVVKLPFNKEDLNDLLWKLPKYKIPKKLNISYYILKRLIRYWNIKTPPPGYFISLK
jgi:hypothetical protein